MVGTFAKHACTLLACLALTGCLDDGQKSSSDNTNPTAPNTAPEIDGTPATTAQVGQTYEFVPDAHDPDGDTLTFKIANRPSWATFSATTGRLSGTPPSNAAARY